MKIRSRALFAYLQDAGVLHDTPEAISAAKAEYRKQYKKQWKQQKRPRREIRFELTLKEYHTIKTNALACDLKPTAYCKNVVLSAAEAAPVVPKRNVLLQIAQQLGMAITDIRKKRITCRSITLLEQAEQQLLNYLTTTP